MTPPDLLNLASGAAVLGLASLAAGLGFGRRTRAARLLTAFFACFALAHLFGTFLLGAHAWLAADTVRWLRVVEVPLVYLLGPLLYGYTVALTSDARTWPHPVVGWHLLPCAVALVISLSNALAPFDASPLGRAIFLLSFHGWWFLGVPYLLAAAVRAYRARARLEQLSADEAALQLGGLRAGIAVLTACWIGIAWGRWPPPGNDVAWAWSGVALNWLTTAAMYLLAGFGLRQRLLLPQASNAPYQRSGIDADQCAGIAAELAQLMRTARLYADPGFDLQQLSARSGWPPNHVSQALNQGLGQNFFEFVNTFRIDAATASLADPDDRRSVLEIALAAGFGSKSTFNTVFKRMTGSTPRDYRRSQRQRTDTAACH